MLSRHLASFAEPLTNALKGDITSTIVHSFLKSSTSDVHEIVDGVVDGKPGGLSQVSNATYDILEKATGPALSFVATQLGLGSIPGKLTDIFKKLDLRS